MTAPSGPEWDAVVEAGEDGAYRYLDGGKGDVDVPVMVTRVLLAAAWPLLRAQVIAERDGLLLDVARSGVEFDDPRIDYVTVQVDRVTWDALRALLPPSGGPPKEGE